MRQLIEISLAFVDLLEAKLEQVNRGVLNLGIALGLIFAASILLILALGLVLYAVYIAFVSAFGTAWASLAVGLMAIGCAAVLLLIATRKVRSD
jgi:hypothetical protein